MYLEARNSIVSYIDLTIIKVLTAQKNKNKTRSRQRSRKFFILQQTCCINTRHKASLFKQNLKS